MNFPVIQFVVDYAREKNKYENKLLDMSLVTNMTYMTKENADWLIENGVLICTSLDGPEEILIGIEPGWARAMRMKKSLSG